VKIYKRFWKAEACVDASVTTCFSFSFARLRLCHEKILPFRARLTVSIEGWKAREALNNTSFAWCRIDNWQIVYPLSVGIIK